MGTAASPVLNPIEAETESAGARPSARIVARRTKQRRQILVMIAACYFLDATALLVYALAGTIPAAIAPSYFAAGLAFVGVFALLSQTGFNDRFKDHDFVVPQSITGTLIALVFAYADPGWRA